MSLSLSLCSGDAGSSRSQHVLLAKITLGEARVVTNDVAGSLVCLEADREGVGRDVPVDTLGARWGGQRAGVTAENVHSLVSFIPFRICA